MAVGNRAHVILMHLGHRNVNVESRISFETVLLNVADNTYDLDRSRTCVVVVNTQLRANCIAVGPESVREMFIDKRDGNRVATIVFVEEPSLHERDLHRTKVIRSSHAVIRRVLIVYRRLPASDAELNRISSSTHRRYRHCAGFFNTRNGFQCRQKLIVEECNRVTIAVTRFGQRESNCESVRRIESRLNSLNSREALDQKPGANQQHERDSQFADHENAAPTIEPCSIGSAT